MGKEQVDEKHEIKFFEIIYKLIEFGQCALFMWTGNYYFNCRYWKIHIQLHSHVV